MAQDSSFDIVSKPNLQEVDNAINMSMKEIVNRFDFKGSISNIERKENKIHLVAEDDYKIKAVYDILQNKLVKRGISLKFIEAGKIDDATSGTKKQELDLKTGIQQEKAKEINKMIKDLKLKVNSQIQGEEIRVFSKSKDDLQAVIQHLKKAELPIELQFVNFR